ncbi:MAG: helix-turn-helix domain-containing protein [Fimbriimonadaceae bacterium]|nr:helix-turn-helix domain-containing protein [Fimbriimonadaceae bacterium]
MERSGDRKPSDAVETGKPTSEANSVDTSAVDHFISGADRTPRDRFRKTEMRAPRPRRSQTGKGKGPMDPELQATWRALPKNIEFLIRYFDDEAAEHYYRGGFSETRQELVRRLLDPELTLEETSRLLGVVPATVRRYTNRGWLHCHRTQGGQRRFRLSDVVGFVEAHGRFPEE